jgi:hypothetical protein
MLPTPRSAPGNAKGAPGVAGSGNLRDGRTSGGHRQVIADGPSAIGTRMGVGAPGFPEGTPTAATPAA